MSRRDRGTAAAAASVLEHRFGAGDPYTLGVEEEYMLLDPESLGPRPAHRLGARRGRRRRAPRRAINSELMQSVIEITTPVCATAAEVDAQLRRLRALRRPRPPPRDGCRFASAGTHPFSLFERQRITDEDRYRAIVDQFQLHRPPQLIFGMHIHAAVDDPEKAIQVVDGLLVHLPEFLALSANSPFWRGEPTGLCLLAADGLLGVPALGRPAPLRELRGVRRGRRASSSGAGCIADYTHIWWDIRPHPRLGTVELRICDAVTRLEDVVALAAYFQSLVEDALRARSSRAGRRRASTASSRPRTSGSPPRYGLDGAA